MLPSVSPEMVRLIQVSRSYRPLAIVRVDPTTTMNRTPMRNTHRNAAIATSVTRSVSRTCTTPAAALIPLPRRSGRAGHSQPGPSDASDQRVDPVRSVRYGQTGFSGGHSPPVSRAVIWYTAMSGAPQSPVGEHDRTPVIPAKSFVAKIASRRAFFGMWMTSPDFTATFSIAAKMMFVAS